MAHDELLNLRHEVQGFQKAIFELQKWKLIVIGAVLAVGLGLSKEADSSSILALFAVPFVTTYSDLMVYDYHLRIALLARFIMSKGGVFEEYEDFLISEQATQQLGHVWKLGNVATSLSSYAANCAVALFGFYYGWWKALPWYGIVPFGLAALGGAIATYLISRFYLAKMTVINRLEIRGKGNRREGLI